MSAWYFVILDFINTLMFALTHFYFVLISVDFAFSRNKEIQFMFVTNDAVTGKGFYAEFEQQKCKSRPSNEFRANFLDFQSTSSHNHPYPVSDGNARQPDSRRIPNDQIILRGDITEGFSSQNSPATKINPAIVVSNEHYIKTGNEASNRNKAFSRRIRPRNNNEFSPQSSLY